MNTNADAKIKGFVQIRDVESGEILVDTTNACHFENFSIALAKALAQRQDGHIYTMAFGNGGSSISGIGTITYQPPNVIGMDAELYNQTYTKLITETMMEVRHTPGDLYSDIVIAVTLGFGEPAGQRAFDDAISLDEDYVFDELGLFTFDGHLLTHVIFHPVQKSLNRIIEVRYTIRLMMF